MKDAEDEAFEAIEKAQGWRKRQIAEQKEKPMTKDEALKLALEALEVIYDRAVFDYSLPADHFAAEGAQEAITAIKEALAQLEQEPVAWLQFKDNEPPVVAPRNLGTPVFLGIRGGLAHDAQNKEQT